MVDEVEEYETIVGCHFHFLFRFRLRVSSKLFSTYIHVHAHSFWLVPKSHFLASLHFTRFSRSLSISFTIPLCFFWPIFFHYLFFFDYFFSGKDFLFLKKKKNLGILWYASESISKVADPLDSWLLFAYGWHVIVVFGNDFVSCSCEYSGN